MFFLIISNKVRYNRVFLLFLPSHSSKVLSGDGLVGGNPTMNNPRLRRGGGGVASSSFILFLPVLVFLDT